jgi:DNA polymerase III gamma/tau subunit
MIAAAAEGSVRDGLSILDQAIAHADLDGEGKVTASQGARHAGPCRQERAAAPARACLLEAMRKACWPLWTSNMRSASSRWR